MLLASEGVAAAAFCISCWTLASVIPNGLKNSPGVWKNLTIEYIGWLLYCMTAAGNFLLVTDEAQSGVLIGTVTMVFTPILLQYDANACATSVRPGTML